MKSFVPTTSNGLTKETFARNDFKHPIKLAVVDDDENDRSQTIRAVDESPDMEMVGSYSSGLQALKSIPSSPTEVVLMDVRMPGVSGIETAKRLKEVHPALVIFMISGFEDPQAADQAKKVGADAFLKKPFSADQFLEYLTTSLRRRRFRDFSVNRNQETRGPINATNSVSPTFHPRQRNAIERRGRSAAQEQGQSFEGSTVRKALFRLVSRIEDNFHTREDLLQEALLHFWLTVRHHPGQRLGWYLQSVKFHLYHLRVAGRSLDSPKRRAAQAALSANGGAWDQWRDILEFDEGIMSAVNADDVLSLLFERLEPTDRTILGGLAEGIGVRELAARLNISHQCVIRGRKRIAAIAIQLGLVPSVALSMLSDVAALLVF